MNMLKGKMVRLRKVKFEDLKFLRDWRNTPAIWENNTQFILLNLKQQDSWFKKINSNISKERMFTIIDDKQNPIGICGLVQFDEDNKNAKVAIAGAAVETASLAIDTELMTGIQSTLSSGFTQMFQAMVDGSKSFKDSMKDLAKSVLADLAAMYLKAAALKMMMA